MIPKIITTQIRNKFNATNRLGWITLNSNSSNTYNRSKRFSNSIKRYFSEVQTSVSQITETEVEENKKDLKKNKDNEWWK